ncbi:hypothetical protein PSACC_03037 [Paramicrosporidium saccamoebae]|uniref:Uncharacterized protein n=1 Tax=Paramicrosporidium saccamoebae TaxID=1246581 RepID=A0A2H9THE6_9FUNG|nr:hypothetical protein PSACC_03037 [Paramicrosporidium saccamoebae]
MEKQNPFGRDDGEGELPPPFGKGGSADKKHSTPKFPVSIGQDDKGPALGQPESSGGMIIGPEHPMFDPQSHPTRPAGPEFLPPGEPDPDELALPGGSNSLNPGWNPAQSRLPPGGGRGGPFP